MSVVRVQAKGRMTVPEPIRKVMGIETGTELACIQTAPDTFECRVLPARVGLREYLDAHALPGPGMTREDIDAAIEKGIMADVEAEYAGLPDNMGLKLVGLRAFIDAHTTSEPSPTSEEVDRIVEEGIQRRQ